MDPDAERLLAERLKLPAPERAELVRKVLARLEQPPADEVEAAWAEELGRRLRSIENGSARMLSMEEFEAFMRRR